MEKNTKKVYGRPCKELKADKKLTVRYSNFEFEKLVLKAKKYGYNSTSDFVRSCIENIKVEVFKRDFPPDIKSMIGTLNHIAANINSLAQRNNRGDFLGPQERDNLREWLMGIVLFKKKVEAYIDDSKSETIKESE